MKRRKFLAQSALASASLAIGKKLNANPSLYFPTVRTAVADRKFTSPAVENLIIKFRSKVSSQELAWLFENCFPNTLDTTVDFSMTGDKPDTYVITGDIDAMWLRDSAAQVWPYLPLIKEDPRLGKLIAGVIHRQTRNILLDPYANAFYKTQTQVGEWKDDHTDMKPGLHERKWEIDSLCYPIRLGYHYWKITGDKEPFDQAWREGISLTLKTFTEQQRKQNQGPYKFERSTSWATDGVPLGGYGYPTKPIGLINSMFRPSDDATIFPFLIPSNFFAAHSLSQAAEMLDKIHGDSETANKCHALSTEISGLLQQHAKIVYPGIGTVYAYEINGLGSYNLMDDANVPSLLSLPYLGAVSKTDPVYLNTRKLVLSEANPFFFRGKAGEGIGGPHAGLNMIWPLSIVMRGLTSSNDLEIKKCVELLQNAHAGTGFMHESFYKEDASKFTRKWFAWANTIFGELLFTIYREKAHLLS